MRTLTLLLSVALVAGCSSQAQAPAREWKDYSGSPEASRFITSTQITKDNVNQLAVAWSFPGGQTDFNPIVARGMVYGRGPGGSFIALDAATGRQIWTHAGVE
jgi:quinoprotein glucose dehydrogenase